jgi:ATP-dependent Clp protease ATP-binding subunit ClpC
MTGLPLDMMDEDPAARLDRLEQFLNASVPGQQRAVRDVTRVVRIAKLRLEVRPERPDGVFMFVGPEGVGKRELAEALAIFLYGSAHKMIEFDMSQFGEQWSLSRLVGAEPGYVGYAERSGLLSKAAEDHPHSILFFRNIDVAHPVVQQFLAESFDQGRFTDATGATISLSNATVAMSLSQIGESLKHPQVGFTTRREGVEPGQDAVWWSGANLVEQLADVVDEVVEFRVLDQAATEQVIGERLDTVRSRLEAAQPVDINLDPELVRFFAEKLSSERKSVASLDKLLQEIIVAPFSELRIVRGQSPAAPVAGSRVRVSVTVEGAAVKVTVA